MAKISFGDPQIISNRPERTNVHYRIVQILKSDHPNILESTFHVKPELYETVTQCRNGIRSIVNNSTTGFEEEDWYIIIQCF